MNVRVGLFVVLFACGGDSKTPQVPAQPPQAPQQADLADDDDVEDAPDPPWPRKVQSGALTFSVYQPQIDSWKDNKLAGRCAIAVDAQGKPDTTFGVAWFTARTEVDRENDLVSLEDIAFTKVSFPAKADQAETYLAALRSSDLTQAKTVALSRLQAELAFDTDVKAKEVAVKNDPPEIIVAQSTSILVLVDGAPVVKPIPNTKLSRVINTRALILSEGKSFVLYLAVGWLRAPSLDGPWTPVPKPPAEWEPVKAQLGAANQVELFMDQAERIKQGVVVYVKTKPAELIETKGPPQLVPVETTNLLYVTNSEQDVFMHTPTSKYYVLVSGRWFLSDSLKGPWTFASPLPPDFAKIPADSKKGRVLATVPGTPQAQEALIANQVPQTATVKRADAKADTTYDGAPQFKPIDGTNMQYATNSSAPVVATQAKVYYTVSNGVWFTSAAATGPWVVATTVPAEVYTIPPSSPVHYVTYVYVYGYTAEYVYVGYTPGYMGTAVAPGGVVVYGTGYVYPVYVNTVYYPPPPTYGYGAGLAVGMTAGFMMGAACHPYWGPYHSHGVAVVHVNHYNAYGGRAGVRPMPPPANRPPPQNRPPQGGQNRPQGGQPRPAQQPVNAGQVPNRPSAGGAYAGRDGNVYKPDRQGNWQQNSKDGWKPASPQATQNLNRDSAARGLGQQRAGGGGGGGRGGGRGR